MQKTKDNVSPNQKIHDMVSTSRTKEFLEMNLLDKLENISFRLTDLQYHLSNMNNIFSEEIDGDDYPDVPIPDTQCKINEILTSIHFKLQRSQNYVNEINTSTGIGKYIESIPSDEEKENHER